MRLGRNPVTTFRLVVCIFSAIGLISMLHCKQSAMSHTGSRGVIGSWETDPEVPSAGLKVAISETLQKLFCTFYLFVLAYKVVYSVRGAYLKDC